MMITIGLIYILSRAVMTYPWFGSYGDWDINHDLHNFLGKAVNRKQSSKPHVDVATSIQKTLAQVIWTKAKIRMRLSIK